MPFFTHEVSHVYVFEDDFPLIDTDVISVLLSSVSTAFDSSALSVAEIVNTTSPVTVPDLSAVNETRTGEVVSSGLYVVNVPFLYQYSPAAERERSAVWFVHAPTAVVKIRLMLVTGIVFVYQLVEPSCVIAKWFLFIVLSVVFHT